MEYQIKIGDEMILPGWVATVTEIKHTPDRLDPMVHGLITHDDGTRVRYFARHLDETVTLITLHTELIMQMIREHW